MLIHPHETCIYLSDFWAANTGRCLAYEIMAPMSYARNTTSVAYIAVPCGCDEISVCPAAVVTLLRVMVIDVPASLLEHTSPAACPPSPFIG